MQSKCIEQVRFLWLYNTQWSENCLGVNTCTWNTSMKKNQQEFFGRWNTYIRIIYFSKKQPHSLRTFKMNGIRYIGIKQEEQRRGNLKLKPISLLKGFLLSSWPLCFQFLKKLPWAQPLSEAPFYSNTRFISLQWICVGLSTDQSPLLGMHLEWNLSFHSDCHHPRKSLIPKTLARSYFWQNLDVYELIFCGALKSKLGLM